MCDAVNGIISLRAKPLWISIQGNRILPPRIIDIVAPSINYSTKGSAYRYFDLQSEFYEAFWAWHRGEIAPPDGVLPDYDGEDDILSEQAITRRRLEEELSEAEDK